MKEYGGLVIETKKCDNSDLFNSEYSYYNIGGNNSCVVAEKL